MISVYMLNHAEAKAIIVYDALYSLIERVKDKCKALKHFVSIPATENKTPEYFLDFKEFLDGQSDTEFEQIVLPMMWRVMLEQPRLKVMVDQLPKTTTGKLQKNIVKQQYWDLYNS